jgi:hypothetical protein
MNRLWIGAGLLILFLLLGIVFGVWMDQTHSDLSLVLEEASQLASQERLQEAAALSQDAYTRWLRCRNATASLADHTPMEEIDSLFRELEVYVQMDEPVHFAATCAQLSAMLKAMSESQSVSWWNLL